MAEGGVHQLATTAKVPEMARSMRSGHFWLHWASGELTPYYLRSPNTWGDVNSLVSSLSFLRADGCTGLL